MNVESSLVVAGMAMFFGAAAATEGRPMTAKWMTLAGSICYAALAMLLVFG